ncbi:MAG: flagellar biosynthetic protein FliO [Planctomycetota bacterium]|nr:flagellar biosynthetic protein FliO [Planctomycetota bacterium]MDA1250548.1 flagellar biosynthetic protein FliO [Planctomycetota bacterium]
MPRLWLLLAAVAVLAVTVPVFGEDPRPGQAFDFGPQPTQPEAASTERGEQPIPLSRNPALNDARKDKPSNGGLSSFGVVLTALAFVLLLALGLAKLIGKTPAAICGRTFSPVDVLFRQNVDPKNAICIVRVGPKLLVLSSSANGLAPLSEISDPIEVEALSIELRALRESSDGALGFVAKWLDRSSPRPTATPAATRPPQTPSPHGSVAGLTVREVEEGRRAG